MNCRPCVVCFFVIWLNRYVALFTTFWMSVRMYSSFSMALIVDSTPPRSSSTCLPVGAYDMVDSYQGSGRLLPPLPLAGEDYALPTRPRAAGRSTNRPPPVSAGCRDASGRVESEPAPAVRVGRGGR